MKVVDQSEDETVLKVVEPSPDETDVKKPVLTSSLSSDALTEAVQESGTPLKQVFVPQESSPTLETAADNPGLTDTGLIPKEEVEEKQLELLPFQQELAEPSKRGENKIIIAPTNCGKTFVAMEIAKVKNLSTLYAK